MPLNPVPWIDVYNKLLPPIKLQKQKALFICVIAILFLLGFLAGWQGKITSLVVSEQVNFLNVNSTFNESSTLELNFSEINSLKVSGIVNSGNARIYYEDLNNSLTLVFDSENVAAENQTNIIFNDACVDTCNLAMPNAKLLIVLRGKNASLSLHNITYSFASPTGVVNALQIPDVYLSNSTQLNLSAYFIESTNHHLTYSIVVPYSVRSVLFDDILFLSERDSGIFNASVIASNTVFNATNSFLIYSGNWNASNASQIINETINNKTLNQAVVDISLDNESNVSVDDKIVKEFLHRKKVPVIIILKKQVEQIKVSSANADKKNLLEKEKTNIDIVQKAVIADIESKNDEKDEPQENLITGAQVIDLINSTSVFTVTKQYDTVNAIAADISPEDLIALQNNSNVAAVFYDFELNVSLQDSMPLIRANDTHLLFSLNNETITGNGQTVCIIDTGIDYNHPALSGRSIGGIDYVNNDADAMDDNAVSHGTHVSGIVRAVAPDARIVPVKICDSAGSCMASNILSGIDYCTNRSIELNISVISGSLGDGGQYDSTNCPNWFDIALQTSDSMGIINVFASGNNGFTGGVSYPSCSPYSVSVGATDKSDNIAGFSNKGSRLDIFAPGASINSTIIGGGYGILSGTSMATPFVSGTVALLKQAARAQNQTLNLNSTVNILKTTGVTVSSWQRINVLNAVQNILTNNVSNASVNSTELVDIFTSPQSSPEVELDFNETVNRTKLEHCGRFSKNFAEINSSVCPELNKSAKITFFNVPFIANITVLRNGELCPADICSNLSTGQRVSLSANPPQVQGTDKVSFNVKEFSNYSLDGDSGFSISTLPQTCGIVLNESLTLTQNVGAGLLNSCFDFNTSGITLDCAGFNITGNATGMAINITSASVFRSLGNITIQNCNIQNFSIGINVSSAVNISLLNNNITNVTNGIWLNNTALSILNNNLANASSGFGLHLTNSTNNTIVFGNFSTNTNHGIYLLSSRNNVVNNNTVAVIKAQGIRIETSVNNSLDGNSISTTSTISNSHGIFLITSSHNNNISRNVVKVVHTTGTFTIAGILFSTSNFNILTNNSLSATGVHIANGILLQSSSTDNIFINNTLIATSTGTATGAAGVGFKITTGSHNLIGNTAIGIANTGQGIGIDILSGSNNNNLTDNIFQGVNGSGINITISTNNVLFNNTVKSNKNPAISIFEGSNNNNFTNTTIISNIGFEIFGSKNILITNTTFQDVNSSIVTNSGSNISLIDNERVTNYSFNNSPSLVITKTGIASVDFFNIINANGTNLSMDVNLTSNNVHVNSSRSRGFNVTANITLFNLNRNNVAVQVDYSDTGDFANCSAPVCTVLSKGIDVVFNVSSFTTYRIADTCRLINESANMTANVVDNDGGACFDFNQSNILFDCAGFNVNSNSQSLMAFNITRFVVGTTQINLSNITIQNCNIQNFSVGINVSSAVNISLFNNNITNVTDGIWLNNTAGSILENNSANATTGVGLYLTNSSNNNISYGNFTNSAGNNNGISLINSNNNQIKNTTARTRANYAILVQGSSSNVLTNNILVANVGYGFEIFSFSDNNTFINNFATSSTGSGAFATPLNVFIGSNNYFVNNSFRQDSTGQSARIESSSHNNRFFNNTFFSTANSASALLVEASANNNSFINSTLIGDFAIEINNSDRTFIINSSFQRTNLSIRINSSNVSLIDNARVTNYSVMRSPKFTVTSTGIASVDFFNIINANGTNLSMDVNLTINKTHVNTSRSSGFNVTANITFFGLTSSSLVAITKELYDNSSTEICYSPDCIIFNNDDITTLIFNVSHFTTYSFILGRACGIITNSTTLSFNLSYNQSNNCVDFAANHITLDCANNKISGVGSGNGVNITGRNNITITNCITSNFSTGINITSSTNITINNTNITNSSFGIFANNTDNLQIVNYSANNNIFYDAIISRTNMTLADTRLINNFTFTNISLTLLKTATTQIKFLQQITANGTSFSNDTVLATNFSNINTARIKGLNSSANITMFDISFSNPQVIVSYPDSSVYEVCQDSICRELSFSGNYVFNVSHFTTFAVNETPPISLLFPTNGSWINKTANISFDWSSVFNAQSYVFNLTNDSALYGAGSLNLSRISGLTDSNFTNSSLILQENTSYYWLITAFDVLNNKTNSTIGNFNIDAFAPTNITLLGNMPANNSAGDSAIFFNWSVVDNFNTTLSCYPTVDGALFGSAIPSLNNSRTNTTITNVPGGFHNLTVTCFDNANANVSINDTRYIVAGVNISVPFNGTVVRPFDNITINVSEIFGADFLDQVNLTVGSVVVNLTDLGNNNWTTTYIILNQTPRIINVTAIGYQKASGIGMNVSNTVFLRLDRPVGQTLNLSQIYSCSNQTYTLNNTNVTITTIFDSDTLVDSINLSVLSPSSVLYNLNSTGQIIDENFTITTNYTFIPTEEGEYNITGVLSTIANQTINASIDLFNTKNNITLNISGVNVSAVTIRDVCSKFTLNTSNNKLSLLMPNNSRADIDINFGDPVELNFTPGVLNNTVVDGVILINVSTDYMKRTNETAAPLGQRRITVWDNNVTNINYLNLTIIYDYSSLLFSITSELNTQLYRCDNVSNNCANNLTRLTITRDTSNHKISSLFGVNNLTASERFMLTEPAVTNPNLLKNPQIIEFNVSKTYPAPNETVNISIKFNMSLALDNLTFSINNERFSPINITIITPTTLFIYRYNYTPTAFGTYNASVNITDQNTFTTNDTKQFFVNAVLNMTLNATGADNLSILDLGNNNTLAQSNPPPIIAELPSGDYNARVINTTFNLTVYLANISISSSSEILTLQSLESTISAPLNTIIYNTFTLNTSKNHSHVDLEYNYSSLLNDTARQLNLQILKCSYDNLSLLAGGTYNCSDWVDTLATVDLNRTLLTLTLQSASGVYSVAETLKTTTSTTTITSSSGGGGGAESKKKTVAALSFVTPKQPLIMAGEDQLTALFVMKNTGKVTLDDVKIDAYTDTKDLSLKLEKTSIPSLAPDEEVTVRLFITSHTEPAPYEITITASASNINLIQTSKIYITLQKRAEVIATEQMLTEMRVAEDILQKNPKCIELKEFLSQAETALKEQQYEKARSLASAAIEGCQELIAYSAELEKPAPLIDLEKLKNYLIIALAFMSVLLLIIGYLIGVLGKHSHKFEQIRKPAFVPARRLVAVPNRNALVGKISALLGKRKKPSLPIETSKPVKRGFVSKPLGRAPGAPFYMPRARGGGF